jgi:hypothetical protein
MPRPQLKPTEEQRRVVKSMAAVGIPHEHIARRLGIRSPKTLRKHFREELEVGMIDADYNVSKTLYKMATAGDHPAATIFWVKTRGLIREKAANVGAVAPPPFIVGLDAGGISDDPA